MLLLSNRKKVLSSDICIQCSRFPWIVGCFVTVEWKYMARIHAIVLAACCWISIQFSRKWNLKPNPIRDVHWTQQQQQQQHSNALGHLELDELFNFAIERLGNCFCFILLSPHCSSLLLLYFHPFSLFKRCTLFLAFIAKCTQVRW